ncbi:glycoside hydrolase family 15 protein (plasmid) [Lichenicola cladoniae]|uniref:Glycoside hydrolase family 15 protein n=1 Tax=Lichenicola cladoniae TaxID=1484109 RepID=A0A6M8HXI5_9PROT|nr:glycoside hydrolase family 15 protein [Lichenicola cladoniae]NPD68968.1 glycoside hydrolase family 15 protein [Acetobacteraceae bacterium]QKE93249.1 glycoside hydrolase family 15 protein [Lichenicola cladoniae]
MSIATMRRSGHRLLGRVLRRSGASRLVRSSPPIADLGLIGDRATAAVITTGGEICWYCPGRFDAPSLLGSLIDPDAGGEWSILLAGAEPAGRRYIGQSAVLETTLRHPAGMLVITDWMPLADCVAHGSICRSLGPAPAAFSLVLRPRPDGGRRIPLLRLDETGAAIIDHHFRLQASHPILIRDGVVRIDVPQGEQSWAVLDELRSGVTADQAALADWLEATLAGWRKLAMRSPYDGAFADPVQDSLRAVRLLTDDRTGAIMAAITTSLPEVMGGKRNYDYRFSWLRDSGMMIRALVRLEPDHEQALQYLGFVASLLDTGYQSPLDPVSAAGGERVPKQVKLPVAGYRDSRPAITGNLAAHQLQLGSLAQFVLAAREIYAARDERPHWTVVSRTADFLVDNWQQKGSGIWEEATLRHYTSSLVSASCALDGIAPYTDTAEQATRYRRAALGLRQFVSRRCLSRDGIYVVHPGSRSVDISAALFPVWGYVPACDTMMANSIALLERQAGSGGGLFNRHLQNSRAQRLEGAFLVGTFWLAHYRIARGELERAQVLIEQGIGYATDLGLFSEEVDTGSGLLLGNLPLGLAHGSLLSAVADYDVAMRQRG